MDNKKFWEEALAAIKAEIRPNAYKTWFKNTTLQFGRENEYIVYASNEFAADWLRKHYSEKILQAVEKTAGQRAKIMIKSRKKQGH